MSFQNATQVRAVSWNIELGQRLKQAAADLTSIEELRNADIFLLQEMDEAGAAVVAEAISGNYAYNCVAKHPKTGRDFGNAVISRWPIDRVELVKLPNVALIQGQPRSACKASIVVGGTEVTVYSVHTEIATMRLAGRVRQFETIADDVAASPGARVVVGGDFNTPTKRSVRALSETMNAVGLTHASADSGPSFRRAGIDMQLDHFFAAKLTAIDSGVAWNASASDHFPIWVQLSIEPTT